MRSDFLRRQCRIVANRPQLFIESRVHSDMATLVMGNPGLGMKDTIEPEAQHATAYRSVAGTATRDDSEIMLAVAAGDESGFTYLVGNYHRQIVHFLYRMVHSEAIAEELAQETFLRVYRSRTSYRAEAKFSTWLYRIATNLAANHARDTKGERETPRMELDAVDAITGTMPEVADSTPDIEHQLMRNERMAAIRREVDRLPERQRMAVLMHKYQEMDYRQIGEVLQLSESATKSLLFRAYRSLRESLREYL